MKVYVPALLMSLTIHRTYINIDIMLPFSLYIWLICHPVPWFLPKLNKWKGKQLTVPWHCIVCTAKVLVNFMTLFAANLQPHVTGLATKWIHTCCYCSQSRNLRTTMETCDFDSWHPTLPVKFSLLHSISISRDTGGINTVGSLSGPHSRAVNLWHRYNYFLQYLHNSVNCYH